VRESRTDGTSRTNINAGIRNYKFAMPQLALTSNFGGGAARTIRTSRAAITRRRRVVNVKNPRKAGDVSRAVGG
jgi:hypothetical protein